VNVNRIRELTDQYVSRVGPGTLITMHRIALYVRPEAAQCRAELRALLAFEELFARGGADYITVGALLGSQGTAFCLFALGAALDLWDVITPALLGLAGETADQLAGQGFILVSEVRA